ncbi:MAG: hypothetical protein QW063_01750 [Candidatus Nanoarchaeia archaeon]
MKFFFKVSRKEIFDISTALTALAFSFQLVLFRKEIFTEGYFMNPNAMLGFFLQSLVIVGFAFVLHELGHKYVAQKKGLWAEFRAWPSGLIFAIIIALITRGNFVFAAPGAVVMAPVKKTFSYHIIKRLGPRDVGLIGIAGSLINLALVCLFGLLAILFNIKMFILGAQVNAWLALFNLIPFNPLDGAKVVYWSKSIWLGTFALSFCALVLSWLL